MIEDVFIVFFVVLVFLVFVLVENGVFKDVEMVDFGVVFVVLIDDVGMIFDEFVVKIGGE